MTDGADPGRPDRRGLVGPFTGRQLLVAAGIVVVTAIGLYLMTRPLAPTTGTGGLPAPAPQATPFLVGQAREGLKIGEMAPELSWTAADGTTATLTDLDGKPITLESLKGRLVWLNFWASWCPPCQSETPVLRDMADRYRDRGLTVVGVAVQETAPDVLKQYVDRYGITYPIGFDATANVFDTYRVFALPTQYFIGPDGRILGVVNGPLDLGSAQQVIEPWLPATAPGSTSPTPSSMSVETDAPSPAGTAAPLPAGTAPIATPGA